MEKKTRRQREIEDMRLEIIDAALHLFITEGYEHVSMRKIAARIEYSATAIYNYFSNKEEILAELLRHCYGSFLQHLQAAVTSSKDENSIGKLRAVLYGYIHFGLAQPQYYQLMFISNAHKLQQLISDDNDRYRGFILLTELVREAIATGHLQVNDVQLVSQSLWASLHGTTALLLTFPQFGWQQESFISFQVETMLKGLS